MTMSRDTTALTAVAPQVLLGNHLKALKLPTFAREYEKVAMELAQDRADYPRHLFRCLIEPLLLGFQHTLVFPPLDAPFLAGRAFGFERALLAG